jgi:hypothetical protein
MEQAVRIAGSGFRSSTWKSWGAVYGFFVGASALGTI